MPGTERAALGREHPGEQLVVLQAQRLDRGDQRLQAERERVADHEHAPPPPTTPTGPAAPQRDGAGPHDPAEHRVGEAERGEPGEGHDVRAEPDHHVEHLDDGLAAPAPPPPARRQADEGQRQADRGARRRRRRPASRCRRTSPAATRPAPRKSVAPGDAGGAYRASAPAALPQPVDGAERVRAGEQQRTQPDAAASSVTGSSSGSSHSAGHDTGRPEALAVAPGRTGLLRARRRRRTAQCGRSRASRPAASPARSSRPASRSSSPCPASPNIIPNITT